MANRAKRRSERDGRAFLRDSLIQVERRFLGDLEARRESITHDGTLGDAVEDRWIELLGTYLPARYRVAKAFAIDHEGHTTEQADCLIYDAHFTPALFGKDKHLYVPAEAIYGTFEIKQSVTAAHLKAAAQKARSVRALKRTSAPVSWGPTGKRPKTPFPILAGLLAMRASWKDGLGATFTPRFNEHAGDGRLDCVLTAQSGFCDRFAPGGSLTIAAGPGALIRGLFRLLTELREKETVVAIDWCEYEKVVS